LMTIAYDSGANLFDNSEAYAEGRAEIVMGKILKKKGWLRDTFIVSSKVFWGGDRPNQEGLSRKHIIEACHAALRRLQVDYLDLYFCHRPDPDTPIEETVRAMSDLIAQGKVLYWGTSEWSAAGILRAHAIAREWHLVPPTMEQPQYHMFEREKVEREFAPLYEKVGLGTTVWSPLASGLLTGKYNGGDPGDIRISMPMYSWLREQTARGGDSVVAKHYARFVPATALISTILISFAVSSFAESRIVRLDDSAFAFAQELIAHGHVVRDTKNQWGDHHPTSQQE